MNRKEFLAAGAVLAAARTAAAQEPDARSKFQQAWVASLMENLDRQFDRPARVALMESCGRSCARRGAVKMAAGGVDKLIEALAGHLGKENARREGETVHLTYTKCYCPLVGDGPPRLPDTWCECSRGWVLEVFSAAAGKPVQVELLESIKRGGQQCRFVVKLA
jgi:predicted hydrocarbon binding protein